jgi:acetyltransferase-like isoleucine patch superfamily enzyme
MNLIKYLYKLISKKRAERSVNPDYREHLFTNKKARYNKFDIGDYTYGFPRIFDYDADDDVATKPTKLKIGKFCSIGSDVTIILGSEHRTDWVTTYPFNINFNKFRHIKGHPHTKGDVIIGNDVWISTNVTILSGVIIGDGAVIGAGSLVTKNVAPYSIVAGVPAKFIKLRFSEEIIESLLKIKWWDMPLKQIEDNIELLQSANITQLIKKLG